MPLFWAIVNATNIRVTSWPKAVHVLTDVADHTALTPRRTLDNRLQPGGVKTVPQASPVVGMSIDTIELKTA